MSVSSPSRRPATGEDPIPVHVRRLLDRGFTSVSEVETLVLLVRDPRPWTAREVAEEFVLSEEHALRLLARLAQARLVRLHDGDYQFAPASQKDRVAAEDLAGIYDRYRLRITGIVLSKLSGAARDFADAFRLRPESEEDDDEED